MESNYMYYIVFVYFYRLIVIDYNGYSDLEKIFYINKRYITDTTRFLKFLYYDSIIILNVIKI